MSAPLQPFLQIADAFADAVEPASFPKALLRWRNREWEQIGDFDRLSDADWATQFSTFPALAGNFSTPLAMRYHGHQFGVYNPEIGDGRGFLYAQFQTPDGRWLDLGTKGSGQTPYSRFGDGRLTLKGGVRGILASEYLNALGVSTSKAFSLVETGEELARNDEPSPTRSAVLVRLQHSHIRFGTFQRVAYYDDAENMARLVDHCVATYFPDAADPAMDRQVPALLEQIVRATARMIGQWMAAGFVHGVMNTDNFNVTGETFDFGPYRFLPHSDPNFTAAYFDEQGLYRFGRQPTQGLWALQQLAGALSLLSDVEDLQSALGVYERAFQASFSAHTHALLGLQPLGLERDLDFLSALFGWMTKTGVSWPQVFHDWFGGDASKDRAATSPLAKEYSERGFSPVRHAMDARTPERPERLASAYFQRAIPATLLIDDVESVWSPIAESDQWELFDTKIGEIAALKQANNWAASENDAAV